MSEIDTLRPDHGYIVLDERTADIFAERMARRFHAIAQKARGGIVGPDGQLLPNPAIKNQWGGKGIIKFNPSSNEIVQGIKQQISLFVWESPDGLPHFVTIDVGRISNGTGGPGADVAPPVVKGGPNPVQTSGGGTGTFPLGVNSAGKSLSYRASAQVVLGTPGTMQDPFYIDINRGQRFTTVASYVAVTAQMNPPPTDEFGGGDLGYVSGSMAVYATLGMAVAPTLAPVFYTQYFDTLTGTGIIFTRVIPPRANLLMPVVISGSTSGAATLQVTGFDNAGNAILTTPNYAVGSAAVAPLMPPLNIPEDCYSLSFGVTGSGVANSLNPIRLVYQLSL